MNLHRLLQQRAAAGKPVRVGLIGAGKFGSMFLNQVPTMAGLEVSVIADLDPERARAACRTGWLGRAAHRAHPFCRLGRRSCAPIPRSRSSSRRPARPPAGIAHARAAIAAGRHIVMVNVEADVLAGPLLAEEARARGRRLFARLWRPAGVDLRAGRLGARLRLRGRRRRQGHQIPARLSPGHARRGLGPLRTDPRGGAGAAG